MITLEQTIAAIRPCDPEAVAAARAHQERLTKPRGSLGVLEEVAVRLAGAAAVSPPPVPAPRRWPSSPPTTGSTPGA
nr:hypothetical protein GCM10020093_048770 [Planobispora longispora]